jgi:hypothetical protein
MSNDHMQSCDSVAETDAKHRENFSISAIPRTGPQQDTKRNFASMWIQRAMAVSMQMHHDEDFRREVARRLF